MSKDIKTIFGNIKSKYGKVASWAVWKSPDKENLASNMEVDDLFDLSKNPQILDQLQNNIVMVGYNFSIPTDNFPNFHNFHSYRGANINQTTLRNASKIRYAFNETPYWGAYMTDIVKNYVESKSENVALSNLSEHFRVFREELITLQANKPLIIAFGSKVYSLLKKHLKQEEYSRLIGVTHYAYYSDGCATHEGYKSKVLTQLSTG
ncbi:MAG TPA: hypothetical protein ENK91_13600 [Bacteroidetes bacterium]|nr:hypothetical protein [Bacteroidota bacterium]